MSGRLLLRRLRSSSISSSSLSSSSSSNRRALSSSSGAAAVLAEERFTRYNSPVPSGRDHSSVLAAPLTRVTTLCNGLRVATESNMLAETATIGVWINAGSRYETDENNGTAHFLEHMIFKGTKTRTMSGLEKEIEDMGGHLNAYTSREQTTYYAKVLKKDARVAVEILSDILQNSVFENERIARERRVILREMQEVETQHEEVVFDHLHATAYAGHPLGRTILGPAENIKSITQKDIKDYVATHYTGPRMVVTAAGAVKHEDLVWEVERLFTNLSTNPMTAEELITQQPAFFTGSATKHESELPEAHIAIAVEGASWTDPDSIALMIMQTLLGTWNKTAGAGLHTTSKLAARIAAEKLASSMMAFNTNYNDTGLFGVYAVAEPDKVEKASEAIISEMVNLAKDVTNEDVIRARNQLKACLLLHLDGTSPIAEDIGRQMLTYGRRMSFAELFARIDAVDAANVKGVAERFVVDKDVAVTGFGAVQNLPDYGWFRDGISQ